MKADIDVTVSYPHPVSRVWEALTSSEALTAWLMPNDFKPVVAHRFTFRTKPAPGFDGIVRCEVLELDPPRRMVWSWAGSSIGTTVTWTALRHWAGVSPAGWVAASGLPSPGRPGVPGRPSGSCAAHAAARRPRGFRVPLLAARSDQRVLARAARRSR
jgi:uncharacterized protein YndB with AHSA1/START domain